MIVFNSGLTKFFKKLRTTLASQYKLAPACLSLRPKRPMTASFLSPILAFACYTKVPCQIDDINGFHGIKKTLEVIDPIRLYYCGICRLSSHTHFKLLFGSMFPRQETY